MIAKPTGLRLVAAFFILLAANLPAHAAPPANDDISHAIVIADSGTAATVTLTDATTVASDPSCGTTPYQSVWYRYTSPVDQFIEAHLQLTSGSTSQRPRMSIWTGAPGALSVAQCNPDAHAVEFQATAGTTYYLEVSSPVAGALSFLNLNFNPLAYFPEGQNVAPPPNDLFWYAVTAPSVPYATTVDAGPANSDSSFDPLSCTDDPDDGIQYVLGDTIWYRYTATSAQQLDVLYTEDGTPGYIGVFTGNLDTLHAVGCSALGNAKAGGARFTPVAGTTYMIELAGGADNAGHAAAQLALQPSPPPITGSVSIDSSVTLRRKPYCFPDLGCGVNTTLKATAHITCSSNVASASVTIAITQGSLKASGSGTASCGASGGDVTLDIGAPSGFAVGAATASGTVLSYDSNYYVMGAPQAVTIKMGR
ncbi:MAG: hypothetical protein JWQ90_42 [Hydrocarboniphaga sp.]|uniref:hypothetical protein n=1 Tax=Hydrocarboniphaga sp. TaxID=2033016 RepID=UPI00261BABE4|nr:hypothetical protein [Hydrocarboniphaga sp.]MDB5967592.1 hypothetical protein [Hydrocarboniphaga sp.]